VGAVTITDVA